MARPPAVAYVLRWREAGSDAVWQEKRFPVGPSLVLDEVERGTNYEMEVCSVAGNGRSSEWVPLAVNVAASNRVGALALPTNVIGNQPSMWGMDTEVTYSATSPVEGEGTATISMSAGALVVGGTTINYGASSASVTGAPGTSRRVYLYYDDPRLEGGTRALGVANNVVDTANVDGRIAITSLVVQFPAPGGSGGGGGGIGGGGGGGGSHDQPQVIQ